MPQLVSVDELRIKPVTVKQGKILHGIFARCFFTTGLDPADGVEVLRHGVVTSQFLPEFQAQVTEAVEYFNGVPVVFCPAGSPETKQPPQECRIRPRWNVERTVVIEQELQSPCGQTWMRNWWMPRGNDACISR